MGKLLEQQLALQKMAEALQLAERGREERDAKRHAGVLAAIDGFAGQVTLPVVLALGRLEARVLSRDALLAQALSLCGRLQAVVEASVLSPGGAFLRALRASVRRPSTRASDNEAAFPSGQKRSDAERSTQL